MQEHPEPLGPQDSIPLGVKIWVAIGVIVAVSFVVVVFIIRPGRTPSTPLVEHPALGSQLPPLRFEPLVNTDGPWETQGGKRATLINFWGPWCMPCRLEMPDLAKIESKYRQREFSFVSVSCGSSVNDSLDELQEQTEQLLQREEYTFAVYADPGGISRRKLVKAARLDGFAYPTTILIDGHGIARGIWIGYDAAYAGQMDAQIRLILEDS